MKRHLLVVMLVLLVVSSLSGTALARARGYGIVFGVQDGPGLSAIRVK